MKEGTKDDTHAKKLHPIFELNIEFWANICQVSLNLYIFFRYTRNVNIMSFNALNCKVMRKRKWARAYRVVNPISSTCPRTRITSHRIWAFNVFSCVIFFVFNFNSISAEVAKPNVQIQLKYQSFAGECWSVSPFCANLSIHFGQIKISNKFAKFKRLRSCEPVSFSLLLLLKLLHFYVIHIKHPFYVVAPALRHPLCLSIGDWWLVGWFLVC